MRSPPASRRPGLRGGRRRDARRSRSPALWPRPASAGRSTSGSGGCSVPRPPIPRGVGDRDRRSPCSPPSWSSPTRSSAGTTSRTRARSPSCPSRARAPRRPRASSRRAAGNGRYQWWTEALDAFGSKPLTGIGAGNYELYWNAHNTLPVVVADAHSLYLETLAELGPLGLLFLLGFLATAIAAGFGRRGSTRGGVAVWLGLLAAGITSAAGEWTWEIPAATVPLVARGGGPDRAGHPAAALAACRSGGRAEVARRALRERPRRARALRPGRRRAAAGFACIWISGVGFLVDVQLSESRSAFDRGDFEEAASNASYAGAIEPWAAAPRLQLAQAEEARGRYDEARVAASEGDRPLAGRLARVGRARPDRGARRRRRRPPRRRSSGPTSSARCRFRSTLPRTGLDG